jgi:hypothetical protein
MTDTLSRGSLVFILGTRRSGTTLINSVLCADPAANRQISEAQLLTRLLAGFSWGAANYDRMVRHYLPTRDAMDDFAAKTCRALLERCWQAQGQPRHLVLKNPELSMHADQLRCYFPEARFVVCVRDPRDQIASELAVAARRLPPTGGDEALQAPALANRYKQMLDAVLRAAAAAPGSFCFVRYEDLVADPRSEAARLGAFCGLDLSAFDPDADWQRMAVSRDTLAQRPSFSQLYGRPVSAGSVGRFRERLRPPEIGRIEQITADLMQYFGYVPVAGKPQPTPASAGASTAPRIEYVMVAEAGSLERQALLLAESIRRLPGAAGEAAVTVVSPRPDRRPNPRTLRQLDVLGAQYLPVTIDSPCPYYGTSFKLAALAEVEKRAGPPILVMLDSDTLFLAPPAFDLGAHGVALRPVDGKGMCTAGPDDGFDEYWRRLCAICGVAYDDIPWIETTTDGLRVKASHNGGLVAANRRDGLFTTSYDFLRRSAAADLFPRPDNGRKNAIGRSGAGQTSGLAGRIWGAAQAALSLAIVARGLEARTLPPTYNVPCHYFGRMVARWPEVATDSVHVHYHWLCDADRLAKNPLLDGRMNVPKAIRALLARHVPVDQPPSLQRQLIQFFLFRSGLRRAAP